MSINRHADEESKKKNIFAKNNIMSSAIVRRLLSCRSASEDDAYTQTIEAFMSHATVQLDTWLRKRDLPFVFVEEQAHRPAVFVNTSGTDDDDDYPRYPSLAARHGYVIAEMPYAEAHVKRVEQPACSTYLEIMSNGYMIRGMDELLFPCGGSTIRIQFRLDGIALTDEATRVPASTRVYALVECLSSYGMLREEDDDHVFEMFMGKDPNGEHKVRTNMLQMIRSILSQFVASALGISRFGGGEPGGGEPGGGEPGGREPGG